MSVDCGVRRLNVRGSVLVELGAIQSKNAEDLDSIYHHFTKWKMRDFFPQG